MRGATHHHSMPRHEGGHRPTQHAPPRGGPCTTTQLQPTINDHHCPTHPTAGQADHRAAQTTQRQQNRPCIALPTTQQPHTRARRSHSRQNQCGQQRDPRQADRVRLRQRKANTTRRPHLSCSTTNSRSDMPATARPRQRGLTITGCAQPGLGRKNPTENTSSTQLPRTR